ncbi:Tripartite ATP-independent periplasmic transporter solute receptor, DctP family [uncultured delta proteobacterium]|uniref:Tripartite ATP-independent periplasmic transporter solute receptor, DctP family n=1 Tax=uncultured delta proteobacterium TaxID=34034 RepID=A0A212JMA4_9DELT|nr:Tripartite ATP-independent periplasmic transporter solute receptor, DctP family [uncultured delta proteobacterium]
MRIHHRIIKAFAFAAAVLLLAGTTEATAAIRANLAHVGAPDHIFEVGAKKFAELVEQKTNGQIIIKTYPGAALGGDRDTFEGLKMGTINFNIQGPVDSFLPITSITTLPYMFDNSGQIYKFLDSDIAEEVYKGLEGMGIVCLAHMQNGWRLITSNKPINAMADLKGMKIRTPESPTWRATFQAFGANPVPIAFNELYSALQQGVCDGQENPTAHIVTQRFYEVQNSLAVTRHMYLDAPLLVSKKFWDKLTPDQQTAVREAAKEATKHQREVSEARERADIEFLGKEGKMTVTYPDIKEFKAATEPVRKEWAAKYGQDLYDRIVKLVSE